jgi:lysophospholipase L1-like esterase
MRYAVELALLILVVCVLALGSERRVPRLRPGERVWIVGDSLAVSLAVPLREALPRQTWVIQARIGATSAELGPSARAAIKADRPAAVLVSYGTNDAAATESFRRGFADRARAIVSDLQSAGIRVYWIEPPSMPFPMELIWRGIRSSGAEVLVPPPGLKREPDGIHPTYTAVRQWAAALAKVLS